jgi:hypothetical protein
VISLPVLRTWKVSVPAGAVAAEITQAAADEETVSARLEPPAAEPAWFSTVQAETRPATVTAAASAVPLPSLMRRCLRRRRQDEPALRPCGCGP